MKKTKFTKTTLGSAIIAALIAFVMAFMESPEAVAQPSAVTLPHDHSGLARGGALSPDALTELNTLTVNNAADFSGASSVNLGAASVAESIYFDHPAQAGELEIKSGSFVGVSMDKSSKSLDLDTNGLSFTSGTKTVLMTDTFFRFMEGQELVMLSRDGGLFLKNATHSTYIKPEFYQTGNYVAETVGCAVEFPVNVSWERLGAYVTVTLSPQSPYVCTSDSNTFFVNSIDASEDIFPVNQNQYLPVGPMLDGGGAEYNSFARMTTGGDIELFAGSILAASWSSSGNKGFSGNGSITFTYKID